MWKTVLSTVELETLTTFWFCSVLFFRPSLQAEHVPSKSIQPKGGLKKRSLGLLPSPLPTQRMHPLTHRPHIHRMTAGEKIIPVVSLAFFKRCQSTPATITGQHLPPQRQTRLWINEKGGALVAAWKGNSAGSTAPSQRKPQEGHSHKACHEHIMPEPNWNLRLKQYFVVFGEKRWVPARRKNKSCMQKRREKQPASWPWDNLDGGHWVKEV